MFIKPESLCGDGAPVGRPCELRNVAGFGPSWVWSSHVGRLPGTRRDNIVVNGQTCLDFVHVSKEEKQKIKEHLESLLQDFI